MKIKNVIFDLDGTLLNTTEGVLDSVTFAANKLGYPELEHDTLLKFVGPPIQNSFIEFYGCDEVTAQKAANIFRDYYKTTALLHAVPYDGIYELCESLKCKGIKMAVATYKREDYALTLLKHFGFDKYCDPMHGADNNNVLKKVDIVKMCIAEMGALEEETVLIGDTAHDAIGAIDAGTGFIAVTYGFGFKEKSDVVGYSNLIGIADTPLDISKLI